MYGSLEFVLCPERDEKTPTCPAHQQRTFVIEGKDAFMLGGYVCPRRPQANSFDVGEKGMSAEEIRTILSPPPPPNCAAASTGACLRRGGVVDIDCCAPLCGEGGCAPGYTYAGQFRFDLETVLSTYPDFHPFCGEQPFCGNTCCVPSDEWDGARAAASE